MIISSKINYNNNHNCELLLYLFINSHCDFIRLTLITNIYITFQNISMFEKKSYLKDILDILYFLYLVFIFNPNFFYKKILIKY